MSTSGPPAEGRATGGRGDLELAADAWVAGFPLLVTTRTMQRIGGLLGVNRLAWQTELAGPRSRVIVAPNRDTLYAVAVLDLRGEPQVLTLPEVTDRYHSFQFLDAWTESFAYVGTRTTGGRAGTWVVAAPGWEGTVPDGADLVVAPTPQVFLLGRYLVDDDADIANVLAIRDASRLEPLSSVTDEGPPAMPPPLGEPAGRPAAVPTDRTFFDELGDALAVNPPVTPVQRDLFARAVELGVGAGRHPTATQDADGLAVLDAGAAEGRRRTTGSGRGSPLVDGWAVDLHVGTYGDDIDLRALVARIGWGANVPEEAVYPVARTDSDGAPLDGGATYRIRFPAGGLPPVDAFWSLSVYGTDMFFVEHPSGRYAIGDRNPDLRRDDGGALEIVLAHEVPDGAANWLPVPAGRFLLMLRLYLPGAEVLEGTYRYPAIERLDAG